MSMSRIGEKGGFVHMAATKEWLIGMVRQYGGEVFGEQWKGRAEEAIAELNRDPREVIPLGDCDNQDETGHCKGHAR